MMGQARDDEEDVTTDVAIGIRTLAMRDSCLGELTGILYDQKMPPGSNRNYRPYETTVRPVLTLGSGC